MDSINELRIDPEFAEKIPPLTLEEYEQLEANILAEGAVLSPLIIWNDVIVDGHNRYRIIQQHPEITFSTHEKKFSDRYEAIAWICKNQLGRRNLTLQQKRYLIDKQYEAEKEMPPANSPQVPRKRTCGLRTGQAIESLQKPTPAKTMWNMQKSMHRV